MSEELSPKSVFEFNPNDLLAVCEQQIASENTAATVTVEILSVDLAKFCYVVTAVDKTGSVLASPAPASHDTLQGSLDLDFKALGAKPGENVALEFVIRDAGTRLRPKFPFTTNNASVCHVFLDHAAEKSAKLWIKMAASEKENYITYNLHFLTTNSVDGKLIEWAFDPKVRNDG